MAKRRKKGPNLNKIVAELLASPDHGIRMRAKQIQDRLQLPMADVLAKVPGATVLEKCDAVGISRQAWYYWLRGVSRPNLIQSKRLAKLTGFDAAEIRGRTKLSPPPAPTSARATRRVKRNRDNLTTAARAATVVV